MDLQKNQNGFTLMEVLVSFLLATGFLSLSLQAMVLNAHVRILSQEKLKATLWIQEQLENVRSQATLVSIPYEDNDSRCFATSPEDGFAKSLKEKVLTLDEDFTKPLLNTNKQYTLERTMTISDNQPYNILQLNYRVFDPNNSNRPPLANLYTEVIADAYIQCTN